MIAPILLAACGPQSVDEGPVAPAGNPDTTVSTPAPWSPFADPVQGSALRSVGHRNPWCKGGCVFVLLLDQDNAVLVQQTHREEPEEVWRGEIPWTLRGLSELERMENGLLSSQLEPMYGCPGCDDGPIGQLELQRSEHRWEYRRPPEVLEEIDGFYNDVYTTFIRCEDSPWVVTDPRCEPWF